MISDVLFEAGEELDRYLTGFPKVYEGELRSDIEKLRAEMKRIQGILDTPPDVADVELLKLMHEPTEGNA